VSHFTTIKTKISDPRALVLALRDKGFETAEVHEEAASLMGYRGDERQQTAEVIVRRKFVGHASNDIGFKRTQDGSFDAIISQYDRPRFDKRWLESLTQRYAYHVALAKLEEQGFTLASEETSKDGRIHLVLRRLA
jgi:hypothetical protein